MLWEDVVQGEWSTTTCHHNRNNVGTVFRRQGQKESFQKVNEELTLQVLHVEANHGDNFARNETPM